MSREGIQRQSSYPDACLHSTALASSPLLGSWSARRWFGFYSLSHGLVDTSFTNLATCLHSTALASSSSPSQLIWLLFLFRWPRRHLVITIVRIWYLHNVTPSLIEFCLNIVNSVITTDSHYDMRARRELHKEQCKSVSWRHIQYTLFRLDPFEPRSLISHNRFTWGGQKEKLNIKTGKKDIWKILRSIQAY